MRNVNVKVGMRIHSMVVDKYEKDRYNDNERTCAKALPLNF